MLFELLDKGTREELHRLHAEMIEVALVEIFAFDQTHAKSSVAALLQRYADAPERERDLFVHEDPVNLAAEIAEKPDAALHVEPFVSRLKSYNEKVRPAFAKRATEQYETTMKRSFGKLTLGG